ncbi:hypothetical protein [Hymenobacter daeguensis]
MLCRTRMLLEMSGLAVGANGKLVDNSGFAVAGSVAPPPVAPPSK